MQEEPRVCGLATGVSKFFFVKGQMANLLGFVGETVTLLSFAFVPDSNHGWYANDGLCSNEASVMDAEILIP